jgi:hypothetical protein
VSRLAVALLAAALASAARAESPRWGSFELAVGGYRPDIDSEFPNRSPGPHERAFGRGRGWMFRAGLAKALATGAGSLEVGLSTGYFQEKGNGDSVDASGVVVGRSGDETTFRIVPATLFLTYRFDLLADRYRIPFAPYARVALERYHWWTGGDGAGSEKGATNGWSATGGLAFLLDVVDPQMARELDLDTGVNHTYLFFEVRKSFIDDFGSSRSWDLSDDGLGWAGGLLFVF